MSKPKIAFYWCASCGGCEETVVDLAEDILAVVEKVDIVLWPVAMDFKYKDIKAMPDKSIVATLLNGAIRSTEQEEMAHLLRAKSQYLIAYGSCAVSGGIPALANQFPREQILQYNYEQAPTVVNEGKTPAAGGEPKQRAHGHPAAAAQRRPHPRPGGGGRFLYVPGCPPTPNITKAAVGALLEGKLPPKGSVLAPDIALCDECARKKSKPTNVSFSEFKRPHQLLADPDLCFLAQGVVCMGPATRSGCGAQCTAGNMPCTGCFGGTSRVRDQGHEDHVVPSAPTSPRRKRARSMPCWREFRIRSARSLSLRPGQEPAASEDQPALDLSMNLRSGSEMVDVRLHPGPLPQALGERVRVRGVCLRIAAAKPVWRPRGIPLAMNPWFDAERNSPHPGPLPTGEGGPFPVARDSGGGGLPIAQERHMAWLDALQDKHPNP